MDDVVLDDEQYPVFEGNRSEVVAWLLENPHVENSHMLSLDRHTKYVSVPEYLGYHTTPDITHPLLGRQRGNSCERRTDENPHANNHSLQHHLRLLLSGSPLDR